MLADRSKKPESKLAQKLETISFGGVLLLILIVGLAFTLITVNANLIKTIAFEWGILVLFLLSLAGCLHRGEIRLPRSSVHLPVLAFLSISILSTLVSPYKYASARELTRISCHVMLYLTVVATATNLKRLDLAVNFLLGVAAVSSVYGGLQHFGMDFVDWNSQARILGTFSNPDFFGGYLVVATPLILSLLLLTAQRQGLLLLSFLATLCLVCLYWTFTRGAWLGCAVALVFLFVYVCIVDKIALSKKSLMRIVCILMIFALVGTIVLCSETTVERVKETFQTEEGTVGVRVVIWKGAVEMFAARPVFGWGLGTFRIFFPKFRSPDYFRTRIQPNTLHAHNEYLELADEMGVAGIAVFSWFIIALLQAGFRNAAQSSSRRVRATIIGLLSGCFGLLVHNLVSVNMRWTANGFFFWLAAALIVASGYVLRAESLGKSAKKRARADEHTHQLKATLRRRPGTLLLVGSCIFAVIVVVVSGILATRVFLSEIHLGRGTELTNARLWAEAILELRKTVHLNPYSLSALYKLGHCYNMTGEHGKALQAYRKLIRLSPDYAEIHYNLGCMYRTLGRPEQAEEEFTTALKQKRSARNYFSVGEAYRDQGKYEEALRKYEQAMEADESYDGPLAAKGETFIAVRRWKQAIEMFELLVKKQPKNKNAHLKLAGFYAEMGRVDESVTEYRTVIALDPEDSRPYNDLGIVLLTENRLPEARQAFQKAITVNPGDILAHFNLGRVYFEEEEFSLARREFSKVVELAPDSDIAKEAKIRLQAIPSP